MDSQQPKRSVPPPPQRPVMATEDKRSRGSVWSIIIAAATAVALFIGMIFLAGALGPVVLGVGLVLGAIYLIACLHYFLWGRWLGDAIREEVEDEERAEQDRNPHG
jgi:Na+-transporting methylmalonyl-CoA/oxaloacetate decarboxylase gamma subunit